MATKAARKAQVISGGCLRHHELSGAARKPANIPRGMLLLTGPPNMKRWLSVWSGVINLGIVLMPMPVRIGMAKTIKIM